MLDLTAEVDIVGRSERCFNHLKWPMDLGSNFLVKPEVSFSEHVLYFRSVTFSSRKNRAASVMRGRIFFHVLSVGDFNGSRR